MDPIYIESEEEIRLWLMGMARSCRHFLVTDRADRIDRKADAGAVVAGADLFTAGAAIDQRVVLDAVLRTLLLVVAWVAPLVGTVEALASMRPAGRAALRFQRSDKRMIFRRLAVVPTVAAGIRL